MYLVRHVTVVIYSFNVTNRCIYKKRRAGPKYIKVVWNVRSRIFEIYLNFYVQNKLAPRIHLIRDTDSITFADIYCPLNEASYWNLFPTYKWQNQVFNILKLKKAFESYISRFSHALKLVKVYKFAFKLWYNRYSDKSNSWSLVHKILSSFHSFF